jgi:signal transduction histidine kinase
MADTTTAQQPFLLADLPPTRRQFLLAFGIVLVLLALFGVTAPFAKTQLPRIDSFIPTVQGVSVVTDLITSSLLFAQFSIVRRGQLLVLASGFLFTALIIISHTLTFPGAFAPTGLLGAGVQSTTYLYNFWKAGFALAVFGYVALNDRRVTANVGSPIVILWTIAIVIVLACGLSWIAIGAEAHLPRVFLDAVRVDQRALIEQRSALLALNVVALVLLWIRRKSVLDLWLAVLCCVLILEILTTIFLITTRFSVGWYATRVYSLFASVLILLVLLSETTALYANLARAFLRQRGIQDERQVAIDAMAASIAHEIAQPIMTMVTNADAARNWLGKTPPNLNEAGVALQHIADAGHRANDLTIAVRSMFKKGAHGRALVNVNDLVREALGNVDLILREQEVSLQIDLRDDLPQLRADRGQLYQVFLNLITNAIEAMGSVSGRRRVLRVSTEATQQSSDVAVIIEDSGPGIESENRNQIFEPFFTTKPTGTGIGLTICKSIIDAHGGTLQAYANKPYGTIFRVTVPAGGPA